MREDLFVEVTNGNELMGVFYLSSLFQCFVWIQYWLWSKSCTLYHISTGSLKFLPLWQHILVLRSLLLLASKCKEKYLVLLGMAEVCSLLPLLACNSYVIDYVMLAGRAFSAFCKFQVSTCSLLIIISTFGFLMEQKWCCWEGGKLIGIIMGKVHVLCKNHASLYRPHVSSWFLIFSCSIKRNTSEIQNCCCCLVWAMA